LPAPGNPSLPTFLSEAFLFRGEYFYIPNWVLYQGAPGNGILFSLKQPTEIYYFIFFKQVNKGYWPLCGNILSKPKPPRKKEIWETIARSSCSLDTFIKIYPIEISSIYYVFVYNPLNVIVCSLVLERVVAYDA